MKFRELKLSTLYQTSDFDDMEVMLCVSRKGEKQLEPLCFLGIIPITGLECVVIGGLTEVQRMVESGEMEAPDGYIPPSISDPYIFDENEHEEGD